MTNLTGDRRGAWLNRQRILVGVPAFAGLLVALAVGVVLARPSLQRVGELEDRLADLVSVQQSLPLLTRKLDDAERSQRQALDQQALLVDLIAGRERIETFLALLDREAAAAGVTLLLYEPMAAPTASPETGRRPPPPKPGGQGKAAEGEDGKDEPAQDPLVALGYRKSNLLLRAEGAFAALQTFLQRMEQLQVLVESSDLELQSVNPPDQDPADSAPPPGARTELGLQLSFYDRMPPAASGTTDGREKATPDEAAPEATEAPS